MRGKFITVCSFFTILVALIPGEYLYSQGAKLSVQGVLRKSNGTVVDDGNYSLTFRIYNVSEGGSSLWSETQSEVEVNSGVYSVLLGTVTELNLPFDTDYFLGVKVGSTPEMSPRAQLTVAPYALSLKGNSNLLPSTGTVGVGTATPNSAYQLDVHNSSGAAKVLVEGTTGAVVNMKKGSLTAQIGYGTSTGDTIFRINPGANNIYFRNGSANRLTVTASGTSVAGSGSFSNGIDIPNGDTIGGNIIFGGSSLDNPNNTDFKISNNTRLSVTSDGLKVLGRVDIYGGKNYSGSYAFMNSSGNTGFVSSQTNPYSISCTERILATEFNAWSDRRIKKDIVQSNGAADLDILSKLRVCDYRYIDEYGNGTGYKKGFIAQEVREVFPESVSESKGFIPNIYSLSTEVHLRGTSLQITMPAAHGLRAGDKVRILFPDGQKDCMVALAPEAGVFRIDDWSDPVPAQVFVFGRQVDDFLQVDYDRIHTLNVSAIQELLRRKDRLESEKARLWKENEAIRASLDRLDERIQKLETTLSH